MRASRIRRRRMYKQQRNIERLDRAEKVETLIQRLMLGAESNGFISKGLEFLFDTISIGEAFHSSYVENIEERSDYLVNLLTEYEESISYFCDLHNFLIQVKVSKHNPITEAEKEALKCLEHLFPQAKNIQWDYGQKQEDDHQMAIRIVGYNL